MPSYALSLLGLCAFVAVAGVKLIDREGPQTEAQPEARSVPEDAPVLVPEAPRAVPLPPPPPAASPDLAVVPMGPSGRSQRIPVPEPVALPPQH